MKNVWKNMQVFVFAIIAILIIISIVIVKIHLNTNNFVGFAYADYKLYDSKINGSYCDNSFYDPVCGEDKVTYDNLCLAKKAGVKVAYQGLCE